MNQGKVYLYFEHGVFQPNDNEVPELIEFTPIAPEVDKDAPITIPNPTGSSNDVSTTKSNEEPAVQTKPKVLVQDQEDPPVQTQPESPTQAQPKSLTQAQPNPPAKHNLSKPKPTSTKSTTTNIKSKPKAKSKPKPKLTPSNTTKTNHASSKSARKPKPKNKPSSSKVTITKPTNKPQPKSTLVNYAKTKPITRSSARSASSTDSDIDGGISEAKKRDLKFKHAPGFAWKKGKEKVLVEDDKIVVENSNEEVDWLQVLGKNHGSHYDAYDPMHDDADGKDSWQSEELKTPQILKMKLVTKKVMTCF
ncbi:hypothetical protein Ahy_B04g070209 isoform A [Arachis hypogaea]|uniref:Uncharacterized protein n=1 Tax=Arachis hypogaea TaxID=3818 RepID=A0A444ZFT7_ARAHY|nr:hypothetical protein Ahy_B04g070209 isoform A [Arachis hypogaea]